MGDSPPRVPNTGPNDHEPAASYIKLLAIHPGVSSAPVRGSLIETPFLPPGPIPTTYECLSYAWGKRDTLVTIIVNGELFNVTPNLHAALQRLRSRDRVRHLWIDAICINQDDPDEKAIQVGMMQQIYERAEHVLIWLGLSDKASVIGFEVFRRLLRGVGPHALRKWCLRQVKEATVPQENRNGPDEDEDGALFSDGDYAQNPLFTSVSSLDPLMEALQAWLPQVEDLGSESRPSESVNLSDQVRAVFLQDDAELQALEGEEVKKDPNGPLERRIFALAVTMNRPYFTRVWMVQEIAVAKKASVICGEDELDWSLFNLALAFSLIGPRKLLANNRNVQRFTDIAVTRQAIQQPASAMNESAQSLTMLSVLNQFRATEATDERDKVFALNGVLKRLGIDLGIAPDYTREAGDIYTEVTLHAIRETKSLHSFAIPRSHDSRRGDSTWPSWVLDWGDSVLKPNLLFPLSPNVPVSRRRNRVFESSGGTSLDFDHEMPGQPTYLKLRGYQLDTLARVETQWLWIDSSDAQAEWDLATFSWCYENKTSMFDAVARHEREDFGIAYECYSTTARWQQLAHDKSFPAYAGGEHPDSVLLHTLEADNFPGGFENEKEHWDYLLGKLETARVASKAISEGRVEEGALEAAYAPLIQPGTTREWDAPLYGPVNRRRLARTARGYLALVGPDSREGDAVVLLQGGPTPYIARRESEHWILISDAYVHGVMYGEEWDVSRCTEMIFE